MDRPKNLVFLISGWGLGHATRTWAICQSVQRINPAQTIQIFSWGVAHKFFKAQVISENIKLIELRSYTTGGENIYHWNLRDIFLRPVRWAYLWALNSIVIVQAISKKAENIFILDSDYHLIPLLLFSKKTYVISQTPYIVKHWKIVGGMCSLSMNLRFFLFEFLDYIFFKWVSDVVICPTLDVFVGNHGSTIFTAPMVRDEFLQPPSIKKKVKAGAAGSGAEVSLKFKKLARELGIKEVYGDGDLYGIRSDGTASVDGFEKIVSQCGFSTLSECLARNIEVLLVPFPNSPEQFTNAWVMCQVGQGTTVTDLAVPNLLPLKKWTRFDGAQEAAEIIVN